MPPDHSASLCDCASAAGVGARAAALSRARAASTSAGRASAQLGGVEPGVDGGVGDRAGVVEQLGGEVAHAQPPQQRPFRLGREQARGHDRPAGGRRGGHPWPQAGVDRHPVLARERLERRRLELSREPLLEVFLGGVGEDDHPWSPLELIAEEPLPPAPERLGREREWATGIGVFSDCDRRHEAVILEAPPSVATGSRPCAERAYGRGSDAAPRTIAETATAVKASS